MTPALSLTPWLVLHANGQQLQGKPTLFSRLIDANQTLATGALPFKTRTIAIRPAKCRDEVFVARRHAAMRDLRIGKTLA